MNVTQAFVDQYVRDQPLWFTAPSNKRFNAWKNFEMCYHEMKWEKHWCLMTSLFVNSKVAFLIIVTVAGMCMVSWKVTKRTFSSVTVLLCKLSSLVSCRPSSFVTCFVSYRPALSVSYRPFSLVIALLRQLSSFFVSYHPSSSVTVLPR